jgi:hypothetical protein
VRSRRHLSDPLARRPVPGKLMRRRRTTRRRKRRRRRRRRALGRQN